MCVYVCVRDKRWQYTEKLQTNASRIQAGNKSTKLTEVKTIRNPGDCDILVLLLPVCRSSPDFASSHENAG